MESGWARPRGATTASSSCVFGPDLGTGSDVRNNVFMLLNVAAVAVVLAIFLGIRVAEGWHRLPPVWAGVALAAIVTVLVLAIWAANGPLQAGRARSSGTPPELLRTP